MENIKAKANMSNVSIINIFYVLRLIKKTNRL